MPITLVILLLHMQSVTQISLKIKCSLFVPLYFSPFILVLLPFVMMEATTLDINSWDTSHYVGLQPSPAPSTVLEKNSCKTHWIFNFVKGEGRVA